MEKPSGRIAEAVQRRLELARELAEIQAAHPGMVVVRVQDQVIIHADLRKPWESGGKPAASTRQDRGEIRKTQQRSQKSIDPWDQLFKDQTAEA